MEKLISMLDIASWICIALFIHHFIIGVIYNMKYPRSMLARMNRFMFALFVISIIWLIA